MSDQKPTIKPAPNGPYLVSNLKNLANKSGKLEVKDNIALCRCGGSSNKPFCDGTHAKNNFSSDKIEGRTKDQRDIYIGDGITLHDNRGICAHAGFCTDVLPSVFKLKTEPWIDPHGASKDEIIAQVKKCPSGALSYSIANQEHADGVGNTEPSIFIAPHGPYVVSGGPDLLDTERGEGASTEHFTICRCGGSKNKPFCDGTHWHIKFQDDQNI